MFNGCEWEITPRWSLTSINRSWRCFFGIGARNVTALLFIFDIAPTRILNQLRMAFQAAYASSPLLAHNLYILVSSRSLRLHRCMCIRSTSTITSEASSISKSSTARTKSSMNGCRYDAEKLDRRALPLEFVSEMSFVPFFSTVELTVLCYTPGINVSLRSPCNSNDIAEAL